MSDLTINLDEDPSKDEMPQINLIDDEPHDLWYSQLRDFLKHGILSLDLNSNDKRIFKKNAS